MAAAARPREQPNMLSSLLENVCGCAVQRRPAAPDNKVTIVMPNTTVSEIVASRGPESLIGEWIHLETSGLGLDAYLRVLQVPEKIRIKLVENSEQFESKGDSQFGESPVQRARCRWSLESNGTLTHQIMKAGQVRDEILSSTKTPSRPWNDPVKFVLGTTLTGRNSQTGTPQQIRTDWKGGALVKTTIDASIAGGSPICFRCYLDAAGLLIDESIIGNTVYITKKFSRMSE